MKKFNLSRFGSLKWYIWLSLLMVTIGEGASIWIAVRQLGRGLPFAIFCVLMILVVNALFLDQVVEDKLRGERKKILFSVVLSLVAVKSLFITPFTFSPGITGVLIGISLWALMFTGLFLGLCFLEKVKWYKTDNKAPFYHLLYYMIPGLIVSTFLWLCNWPCIMQPDSAYMWEMTLKNHYLNSHPITYTMFIKLLRDIWEFQGFMVLLQILFCSFVYGYTAYTFEKLGSKRIWCWALAIGLAIIPANAINSVTFLKDIPYNMSLVLMSVVLMELIVLGKSSKPRSFIILFAAAAIALMTRHNAILTVPLSLGFVAYAFMRKREWKVPIIIGAILIVAVSVKFGTVALIENKIKDKYHKVPSLAEVFMLPTAQCAYTTHLHWEDFTDQQKEDFNWYFDAGYFNDARKRIENWNFNYKYQIMVHRRNLGANWQRFVLFYLGLLKDFPGSMIKEYEMITSIVWSAPNYGYTMARNFAMPSWAEGLGLEFKPLLPEVHTFIDTVLLRPKEGWLMIFWRPALSLLLCFLISYLAVKRWGFKALGVIGPAFFNAFGYMLVNPAQCTRYLYSNFSIFFIFLLFTLMVDMDRREKQDEITDTALDDTIVIN